MKKTTNKRKNRRSPIFYILLIFLLCVFGYSAWQIGRYFFEGAVQKEKYDQLAAIVEQAEASAAATAANDSAEPAATEASEPVEETEPPILPEYKTIVEMNPDMVGWLKIDGTVINYPVMQTPESPEYYLKRDFYKDYSDRGCLFAEEGCDVDTPSDNVTIYGHCMKDGSMFADLDSYIKKSFWEEYPLVAFDSLTQHRTYRIFAVFKTTASVGEGFPYHTFINAMSEAEFNSFISQCTALSFYDTGITPAYGDKLICLSTCEYTLTNGRLVVAAVLEEDETQALPMTPSGALCIISTDTLWTRRVSGCSLRFPDSC